jgi:ATP-binding cassette subfamily B protein
MAFHLNRETGKIIRIVSRGGGSFTSTMRMSLFSLGPTLLEIAMTLIVFASLFDWKFLVVELLSIVIYLSATYYLTERRAKDFKE